MKEKEGLPEEFHLNNIFQIINCPAQKVNLDPLCYYNTNFGLFHYQDKERKKIYLSRKESCNLTLPH